MYTAMITTSLAIAAGGCIDSAPSDEAQPLSAPLVSAERGAARVAIYQVTPDTLAVVATGDLPESIEGRSPVEIYEAIAATPAPAALVATQARIAAAQAQRGDDHVGSVSHVAAPTRSGISNLTAADFRTQYCDPGTVDFDYCWPNSTNDYSTTFYNIHWIHSHVNVYSGTLTHTMKYRAFAGSWKTIKSENVSGSTYVSTFPGTDDGDYEVSLTNAAGDGYHLSLHGDF
jgi:hypothetical protein